MASKKSNHGFQAFGRFELRKALHAEIQQAEQELRDATDGEERVHAQEKLDVLHRQRDEVDNHGGEWLFRSPQQADESARPFRRSTRVRSMIDVHQSVKERVLDIFRESFGDLAARLDGSRVAAEAMDAIGAALTETEGVERAHEIAFHMADWNWDAAFIVALHLCPERFTSEEIEYGIGLFLCHAPNHIRAACGLTEQYVWTDWPTETEPS